MLKHTDSESNSTPAAQVRVTPEELAAAITRIEARKEVQQRHQAGTVAIGEVVQQLGLDATPEEVLAEVQAERARLKPPPKKRLTARQRLSLWLATGTTVVGLGLAALWFTPNLAVSPSMNSSAASSVSDISRKPHSITLDSNLLVREASGRVAMLSEVGDNQPVQCIFDGNRAAFGPYSPSESGTFWTLIKHGGKVYVRGRVQAMSAKVLARDGMEVLTSSPNVSSEDLIKPITLPVDGFDAMPNSATDTNTMMFHAQNIRLDKHAWEKW